MDPIGVGVLLFPIVGVLVGLVWHALAVRRAPALPLPADVALGSLGGMGGALIASFFEREHRMFTIFPASVVLAIVGALSLLAVSLWILRIPATE